MLAYSKDLNDGKIDLPNDEEPLRDGVLEVHKLPQLTAGLGELDNDEGQDQACVLRDKVVRGLADEQ
jgi:hypothetical protein